MRKAFVSNLLFLVGLNLLIKPLYVLGVETEVQNRVGSASYGSYFSLISFALILNLLPDLGITNWFNRHTAQKQKIESSEFNRILTLRLLLGATYILVCFLFGILIQYSKEQLFALLILAINQFFSVSILFLRAGLTGMHQFWKDSVISILDRLLLLISVGGLLMLPALHGVFRIEWLVFAQSASLLITFALAYYWVLQHAGRVRLDADFNFSKDVLLQSMPFAVFSLLAVLILRADSVLIERLSGAVEAGIYAQGFRLFEAYTMLSYLFAVILLPMFAKLIAQNSSIYPLLSTSNNLMLFGSWVFAVFCISFPQEVLEVFYDDISEKSIQSFRYLMLGCFAFSMQYVFGTLLTADKRLSLLIKVLIPLLVISVVLNILLIPSLGVVVAAQIHAMIHCLILIAEIWIVLHVYRINAFKLFKSGVSFMVLSGLLAFFLKNNPLTAINELHVLFKAGIFIISSIFLTTVTGLINVRNLRWVFSKKSDI